MTAGLRSLGRKRGAEAHRSRCKKKAKNGIDCDPVLCARKPFVDMVSQVGDPTVRPLGIELTRRALTASGALAIRVRLCLVAYIALAGCFFLARKLRVLSFFGNRADHLPLNTLKKATPIEALLLAGGYGLRGCP